MTKNDLRFATIVNMLKKKSVPEKLKLSTNVTAKILSFDPDEETIRKSWRNVILEEISKDEELESLFIEYAVEPATTKAINEIIDALEMKYEKGNIEKSIIDLLKSLEDK